MRRLFGVAVLVLAVTALSATSASAAGPAPPASAQAVVERVSMRLDCSRLSGSAVQYAASHGYCPASGAAAVPETTVDGNCGDSFLYMWNHRGGEATFWYGFHSTKGTVLHRDLHVSWVNWNQSVLGNFNDSIYMWDASYSQTTSKYTKPGFVSGVLYGDVLLWWGGICTLLNPTSSTTVTW
jgi:hypothetical protein